MKVCIAVITILSSFLLVTLAVKEEEGHGAKPHNPVKHEHYHDGEHDAHYDHEAILGDRELEKEFDELEPDEAKRRLALLVKQMDVDQDGYVNKDELLKWILASFQKLDKEDSKEQLEEHDEDKDKKVTWTEFLSKQYGYNPDDMKDFHERTEEDMQDFTKMIEDEKKKFDAADLNKDGALDEDEYVAFVYPYDFEHMHDVEMERTLKEQDKNKDGIITKEEFIGDEHSQDREWLVMEEERFGEYDKNKDGQLDKEEMRAWVLPDNNEAAFEEAEHLIDRADDDKDGQLSVQEIVDHHDDFVGSQATNYGAYLPKDEL